MGLDWIAQARKNEDGTETAPQESLGMKRLSKDDRTTVEAFRKIYDSHHEAAVKGTTPEKHQEYWKRPFETVLDEVAADEDPPFLEGTEQEKPPEGSGGSFIVNQLTSFRGKRLQYCGLPQDIMDRLFGTGTGEDEQVIDAVDSPKLADDLRHALENGNYDTSDEYVKEAIEEGIAYLEFWSQRGHPIFCWY